MKVILLIGRIACGKTTYARSLPGTLLLSCDQLMQGMFPGGCGESHDLLAARARRYLYGLAKQSAALGITPVMDFGFWNPDMRREAAEALAGCTLDWRYLDPPEAEWRRRIEGRNAVLLEGRGDPADYFVDEGLLSKLERLFVPPTQEELPGFQVIQT